MQDILLAQEAAPADWLSRLSGDLVPIVAIVLGSVIGLIAVIASFWWKFRETDQQEALKQAELDAAVKKAELETALKREMLSRGMSAEDIERVLKAQLSTNLPPPSPRGESNC